MFILIKGGNAYKLSPNTQLEARLAPPVHLMYAPIYADETLKLDEFEPVALDLISEEEVADAYSIMRKLIFAHYPAAAPAPAGDTQ